MLSFCIAITIYCQVVLCFETRRHEKPLASQQVSQEGRQKFLKEKKAFKVTTTVLLVLVLSYTPLMVVRILIVKSVFDSFFFFTTSSILLLNSLFNPVICCVRIRNFHTAFIEIIFEK